jgi:DNA-binding MarR family transcriptional regulator
METRVAPTAELRQYRNSRLYRSLTRTLRAYNRRLVAAVQERGFPEFSPAFPQLLSNLDIEGTTIGVLAARAGITRQAAGQLAAQIERCGYIERAPSPRDARATVVRFTALGRSLLATVLDVVEEVESEFAAIVGQGEFADLRVRMLAIADAIDPGGSFGTGDEEPAGAAPDGAGQPPKTPSRSRPSISK